MPFGRFTTFWLDNDDDFLNRRQEELPRRNNIDWTAEIQLARAVADQQMRQQYLLGDQAIVNDYFNLNRLNAMYQVHDEFYLYEEAKKEEDMATVKVLKNSVTIQSEDDRLDVEYITRKDGSTCFTLTVNDQVIEIPVNQTSKLNEFIKSKLTE